MGTLSVTFKSSLGATLMFQAAIFWLSIHASSPCLPFPILQAFCLCHTHSDPASASSPLSGSISGGSLSSWQPPSVSGASCPPRRLLGAGASPSTESWCPVLSRHRAASMPSPPFSSSHSALSQHVWLTSTVLLDYTETDNFLYQQFASGSSLLLGDKHV